MTRHLAQALQRGMLVATITALTGCYHYAPVSFEQLQPGADVRAQLSGAAVQRLREGTEGQGRLLEGFSVTGDLLQLVGDGLLLSVPITIIEADFRARVVTQNLLLSRADVVSTEVKRLDKRRTAISVVAAASALFLIIQKVREGAGHSGVIPVIGGPPESRAFPSGTGRSP